MNFGNFDNFDNFYNNVDNYNNFNSLNTVSSPKNAENSDFGQAVAEAMGEKFPSFSRSPACEGLVLVSPKAEKQAAEDPDFAKHLKEKLQSVYQSQLSKNDIIIIDRKGEASYYSLDKDDMKNPTPEEIKETLKARARKKARLDAYFKNLEQVCVKTKLRELDNIRKGKKYRASVSQLETLTRSIIHKRPQKDPEYSF